MPKTKKNNSKKSNPKNEEKPIIKTIKKTNDPKKKQKQLKNLKKAVEGSLVETPPAPVLVDVKESQVKQKAGKKSNKPKKTTLKEAPELQQELKVGKDDKEEQVEGDTKNAVKKPISKKKEVVANASTDPVKQAIREKNKLNKKLKKAEGKEKTAELVSGPGQTIFVGNVPSNTKRVQLMKLFSPYGKVMSIRFRTANGKIIFKHKMRRESAALNAYVLFDSVESATKALELNGTSLKDQILRVQKVESSKQSSDSKNTVFVGNLKYSATDDKLHQIFSSCGEIEYVRTLQGADTKGCIGTAYVCFKSPDAVGLALELKGTMLDERPINVERYSVKKMGAHNKRIAEDKTVEKGKKKGGKPLEKAAFELRKGQKHGGKQFQGKKNKDNKSQDEQKKKSQFRGVKSEKSMKKPKKKIPSQMKRLANKIAPKE